MPATVEQLRHVPLFADLFPRELQFLASSFKERVFDAGSTVVAEGSGGVGFFIIEEGDATVSVAGHTFEVLHCPGHSPGSVVLVNRAGFEDGLSFWGGSRVVAPGGRVCFEAPLLESGLFTCELDWDDVRRYRVSDPTLRSERLDITLAELRRILRERRRRLAGRGGLAGTEAT